ncbi:MAG TPA: lysophospholipase [Polyangia bacterium]|jgi:alpha-beta hydrolase superfamily lysophospholipase|nr:lysophospholipase [Polyangia bacterium]
MSFFQSRDGTQLHEETWPAEGKPQASVIIIHGYGEHIGRYDETARALAAAGFSVRGLDLRGHGQSGGVRGFCNRFDEYLDDVDAIVARARPEGLPIFLVGHSFGALVAPHYALHHPTSVAGLVLTSPYWKLAMAQPAVKIWAGKLASLIAPKLALPTRLTGAMVCRDPELQAKYDVDPLNNKNATARWFTESNAAQLDLVERAPQLTVPTLLLVGEADRVASAPQARVVFERIGSHDKTLRMLTGQYHEVLNEPKATREHSVAEIVEWLRAHATKAATTAGEKLRASEA